MVEQRLHSIGIALKKIDRKPQVIKLHCTQMYMLCFKSDLRKQKQRTGMAEQ